MFLRLIPSLNIISCLFTNFFISSLLYFYLIIITFFVQFWYRMLNQIN